MPQTGFNSFFFNNSLVDLSCFTNINNTEITQKPVGNYSLDCYNFNYSMCVCLYLCVCVPVFDTDQRTQSIHPGKQVEHREVAGSRMLLPTRTQR